MESPNKSDFVKDIMKTKFEALISERDLKHNSALLTREKYSKLISDVKSAKTRKKKLPSDYRLLHHYDTLDLDGHEMLIVPVKDPQQDVVFYCSSNMLFEILYETHLSISHGGRDRMKKVLNGQYKNITNADIQTFINLCKSCQQKRKSEKKDVVSSKPIAFPYTNSRCQVNIIDHQSHPDGNYKFVLIYQDYVTKFIVLKPLETTSTREIANVLLDIFLLFGAPCILQSDNGREFCSRVIKELMILWPELKLVHGKSIQNEDNLSNIKQDVEKMLTTWMQEQKCTNWSLGLKFVQFMKNRAFHSEIKRAPHEAMFGSAPRVGLSTTSLSNILENNILDEESLENAFNTTQLPYAQKANKINSSPLRDCSDKNCISCLKECTDNFVCMTCDQPLHESCSREDSVCDFCYNQTNIEELDITEEFLEIKPKKIKLKSEICF